MKPHGFLEVCLHHLYERLQLLQSLITSDIAGVAIFSWLTPWTTVGDENLYTIQI